LTEASQLSIVFLVGTPNSRAIRVATSFRRPACSERFGEERPVFVGEGGVLSEDVADLGPDGNFDPLDTFDHQEPETPIEGDERFGRGELGPCSVPVLDLDASTAVVVGHERGFTEGVEVSGEAVVADFAQHRARDTPIGDADSLGRQLLDLVADREPRLHVLHGRPRDKKIGPSREASGPIVMPQP
jgi:hypothetical protein